MPPGKTGAVHLRAVTPNTHVVFACCLRNLLKAVGAKHINHDSDSSDRV